MNEAFLIFINDFGYFGLFILMFLENIFPPIPSVLILPFTGLLTTNSNLNPIIAVIISTISSYLGTTLLYYIGIHFSKEKIYKFIDSKIGKILHLKKDSLDKAIFVFSKKDTITVFFCRFIPIVRSLISVPAGMIKMNFLKFSVLSLLGIFLWNFFLIYLGVLFKDSYSLIISFISNYLLIIVSVLIILYFLKRFLKSKKKNIN